MMKLLALIALAPAVAFADDVPCKLAVTDAPDDVRIAVQEWIRVEDRCTNLDVRVTPADSGYLVRATTPDGRTFRRWAPDAKTAAVLVVSWAADDAAPLDAAPATSTATHAQFDTGVASAAPEARGTEARRDVVIGAALHADIARKLGIRVAGDVWTRGAWRFGASGAWSALRHDSMTTLDTLTVVATVGRAWGNDRIQFRMYAGVGLGWVEGVDSTGRHAYVRPAAELSLGAWIRILDSWSVNGGLLGNGVADVAGPDTGHRPFMPNLWLGVGYGI